MRQAIITSVKQTKIGYGSGSLSSISYLCCLGISCRGICVQARSVTSRPGVIKIEQLVNHLIFPYPDINYINTFVY